jgi:hypothetical protein
MPSFHRHKPFPDSDSERIREPVLNAHHGQHDVLHLCARVDARTRSITGTAIVAAPTQQTHRRVKKMPPPRRPPTLEVCRRTSAENLVTEVSRLASGGGLEEHRGARDAWYGRAVK